MRHLLLLLAALLLFLCGLQRLRRKAEPLPRVFLSDPVAPAPAFDILTYRVPMPDQHRKDPEYLTL